MNKLSLQHRKELRKELIKLFPKQQSSIWIIEDAGIPIDNIPLDDIPSNNWHAIIREAGFQEKEQALLAELLDRYPTNQVFRRLFDYFETPQNDSILPPKEASAIEVLKFIKGLISDNKLEDSITLMAKIIQRISPDLELEVIHLSGRNSEINHSINRNTIRREDEVIEKNKVRLSLIQLVDQIARNLENHQKLASFNLEDVKEFLK